MSAVTETAQAAGQNESAAPAPSRLPRRRRKRMIVSAALLAVIACSYVAWAQLRTVVGPDTDYVFHRVERGDLKVIVVERGNLESANNKDLVCRVEARSPGAPATTIRWIVPEGHMAKEGELLVELDDASLKDQVTQQRLKVEQAKAALTTAESQLEITRSQNESDIQAAQIAVDLAEIDLKKYLEGDYVKEKRTIEGNILIAEEEVKRAVERLEYSKRLNQKGYVSNSEVESDQLALTRAENNLAMAKEELRVLEQYTKPRTEKDLMSKREEALRALQRVKSQAKAKEAQAEADMLAKKVTYETEQATLRKLEQQLANCKLYAPIDGMVTYANEPGRFGRQELQIEEGASVRERQRIIRIPDLSAMQVNVKVHEAKVSYLQPGQPANIRVESMPDRVLRGTVKKVATMADAQSWFSTGVQVFTVLVSIDEQIEGLKPGMTAEVQILADDIKDVLTVPVQAVVERNGLSFCYVKRGGELKLVPVELGASNEKFVVVKSGLQPGDLVVENLATTLPEDELKALAGKERAEGVDKDAWAGRPAVKRGQAGASGERRQSGSATAASSGSRAATGPGSARPASRLMSRFDKNGDGVLSMDELPDGMAALLRRYDSDGDGSLDAKELAAMRGRSATRRSGGPRRMPDSGTAWIQQNDKNRDGKVTRDELPEFVQQFWSTMDTNGDGAVDGAEADAIVQRMKQRMGARQGQGGGPGGGHGR